MDGAQDSLARDALADIRARLALALAERQPVSLRGGGTHDFLRPPAGPVVLALSSYAGVIAYAPSELVIVARAGTPLVEIETLLAQHGQCLAFEAPRGSAQSTLGGVISTGLSGPARPYTASVRDHVLGVGLLNSQGELLQFGGRVMKNVAGYDVSRLVTGAWGVLGPIMEIAVRVVPAPATERCLRWPLSLEAARAWMREAGGRFSPLTGLCHDGEYLHVRFSGSAAAVAAAAEALINVASEETSDFWRQLRDWALPFFADGRALWRLVLPSNAPNLALSGSWLWDWGGAQRWLKTTATAAEITACAAAAGGYASAFDANYSLLNSGLTAVQRALQARIRHSFDPLQMFNPELSPQDD